MASKTSRNEVALRVALCCKCYRAKVALGSTRNGVLPEVLLEKAKHRKAFGDLVALAANYPIRLVKLRDLVV